MTNHKYCFNNYVWTIKVSNKLLLRHPVFNSKSMYFGTFPKIIVAVSYTHLDVYKRQELTKELFRNF